MFRVFLPALNFPGSCPSISFASGGCVDRYSGLQLCDVLVPRFHGGPSKKTGYKWD